MSSLKSGKDSDNDLKQNPVHIMYF